MSSPTPSRAQQWALHRSATDTKVAGVCGGLAERWDVDPVLVRVGCVLLALTGGVGVVLYLAGWLLLPVAGTGRAAVDELFGGSAARWPRGLWVALISMACIGSFVVLGAFSPFGLAPALVLAAVWFFGFRRAQPQPDGGQRGRAAASSLPAPTACPPVPWSDPPTAFTQAASAWQARVAEVRTGVRSPAPTWTPPPFATIDPSVVLPAPSDVAAAAPLDLDTDALARAAFLAEPDPVGLYAEPQPAPLVRPGATRSARRLRLAAVTALGVVWLGLGIADAVGVTVPFVAYAAAGLLVVALALVAATWLGRARGLLPVAVVLAALTATAAGSVGPALVGPAQAVAGLAEHRVAYASTASFPANGDDIDVGRLDVDLTRLQLSGDATYRARLDTGRIVVTTPPGTGVALRYRVDAGTVDAYGDPLDSGTELEGDRVLVPAAAGQHTLTLDLRVDTGTIGVRS